MTEPLRLDLPWIAPPLRDNDRGHWAPKARKVADARQLASILARQARLPKGLEFVTVCLHWQPSTNRRRDVFSISPTLKPLIDGLVDYGLVPDDDTRHVQPSCCVHDWHPKHKPGCWLTITPRVPAATSGDSRPVSGTRTYPEAQNALQGREGETR